MSLSGLKIAACAVLVMYYVSTLWIMTNPRTSQEFKDHFIDRISDCWLRPQATTARELPDRIDFITIPNAEGCRYLRSGWSPITKRGSEAHTFELKLDIPYKPDTRALQFTFDEAPDRREAVRVALAGTSTEAEISIGPEQQSEITIPVGKMPDNGTEWHFNVRFDMPVALWNAYNDAPRGRRHIALTTIQYVSASTAATRNVQ